VATSLFSVACDESGGDLQPEVLSLEAVSGNEQEGSVGTALPEPIVVRVTTNGIAAPLINVVWSTSVPNGQIVPALTATDANGMASATWTLGAEGANTAQATVDGAIGSPVSFTATATIGLPPAPATANVSVRSNSFVSAKNSTSNPAVDTVAVGGAVTWTWAPPANPHNVTSTGTPEFTGQPTVVDPPPFTVTFSSPGTYNYYCTLHGLPTSGMRGRIVVR
jgi:plastocyanin